MPSVPIDYVLRALGSEQVQAAIKSATEALQQNEQALKDQAQATGDANKKNEEAKERFDNVGGAIALVSRGLSEINPKWGQQAQLVAGSISQITSLANQMGAAGIAIGVVSAAATDLASDIAKLQAAEQLERQALDAETAARHAHVDSLSDEVAAIQRRTQAQTADAQIQARLRQGTASVVEVQAHYHQELERQNAIIQANVAAHDQLKKALDDAMHSRVALGSELMRMQRELDENEDATQRATIALRVLTAAEREDEAAARANAAAHNELTQAMEKQKRAEQELRDAASGEAGVARQNAALAALERGQNQRAAAGAGHESQAHADARAAAEKERAQIEAQKAAVEQETQLALQRDEIDKRLDGERRRRLEEYHRAQIRAAEDAWNRQKQLDAQTADRQRQQATEHEQQLLSMAQTIGNSFATIGDIIAAAEGKSAKAQRDGQIAQLAGKAITEGWNAAIDFATAAGAVVENPPLAVSKGISGGMHTANAIRMAAEAGSVAGGGASAGGAPAGIGAGAGPARPTPPTGGAGGEAGTHITIKMLGPMVAAGSQAQMARMLAPAFRAAYRLHGRAADGMPG